MSTLKDKAQEILNEKESKLSSGEFLNTEQIFGIDGTFNDERGNTLYAEEIPQVSDLPADASIEVISQVNSGDTVINPMTDIVSRVGYGAIAESIGLVPEVIKSGETVLGIDGNVEELMGDIAVITPSIEPQIIYPEPGYNAFTSVEVEAVDETIDPNIVPENIREGVSILGVDGNMQEGIDTSDADATETDILFGKTAYIDGEKVTGKIPTYDYSIDTSAVQIEHITDNKANNRLDMEVSVDSCAYSRGVFLEPETYMPTNITYATLVPKLGLSSGIIKRGETILGISGTLDGIDTSDATAGEYDIAMGKTAYVNGNKIIGAVPVYSNYTYTKMYPTVGNLTGDRLEIFGRMGTHQPDTVLLRPEARVQLTPLQSDIANAVGLTADKIKIGEIVLGIRGTYSGGDTVPITIPIDYNRQEFVLYCGAIADILDTNLSAGQKSIWKCCDTSGGLSNCCIKLCDLSRSGSSSFDGFMDGIIGIAINCDDKTMMLVDVTEEWTASICTIDAQSSSSYYGYDMTYNDLIALLRQIGTVALQADGDIYFELYNNFSHICCKNLQSGSMARINTNQLYLEVRDI